MSDIWRSVRAAALPTMLVTVLACNETPTATPTTEPTRHRSLVGARLPSASVSYESMGTYTLGVTSEFNPTISVAGPTTPGNKKILVRITATGTLTTARSIYWSNDAAKLIPWPGSYGPSGFANVSSCYANLLVGSSGYYGGEIWYAPSCTGGSAGDTLVQGYAILAGASTVNRASGMLTGSTDCYNSATGYGPCNTYTDNGQAVTIEKVIPTFTVSATPTTNLNPGDTVTVTATVSPDTLGGKEIPWTVDSVVWVPAYGSQSSPCGWNNFVPTNTGNPRVCRKPFTRSGTLTVWATVNGDKVSGAVSISVKKPKLILTATPSVIQSGAAVTFEASIQPGGVSWSIQSWSWTPNSGSGGISSVCNWNNNPCTRNITKTGTMVVTATVDGQTQTASAPVWVTNCITGDSILDDARIREELLKAWTLSTPTSVPQNRREHLGQRYTDSDGNKRDSTFDALPGSTPCTSYGPTPPALGITQIVWHTHPFQPLEPGIANTDTLPDICPRDSRTPPGVPRYSAPGPSPGDNQGFPYIIVDKRYVYSSWDVLPGSGLPMRQRSRISCDLLGWL